MRKIAVQIAREHIVIRTAEVQESFQSAGEFNLDTGFITVFEDVDDGDIPDGVIVMYKMTMPSGTVVPLQYVFEERAYQVAEGGYNG